MRSPTFFVKPKVFKDSHNFKLIVERVDKLSKAPQIQTCLQLPITY